MNRNDLIVGCRECASPLTNDEKNYYGNRCERCEKDWHSRIEAWRRGGEDKELDELYGCKITIN